MAACSGFILMIYQVASENRKQVLFPVFCFNLEKRTLCWGHYVIWVEFIHSRSYSRGRRGHHLVWFSQNHGYFPPKRSQPGWFWSLLITSPRLILMSGYGHVILHNHPHEWHLFIETSLKNLFWSVANLSDQNVKSLDSITFMIKPGIKPLFWLALTADHCPQIPSG